MQFGVLVFHLVFYEVHELRQRHWFRGWPLIGFRPNDFECPCPRFRCELLPTNYSIWNSVPLDVGVVKDQDVELESP